MADQESQERLTGLMLEQFWPPSSADALRRAWVEQLIELQQLRGNGLTEEEYTGWRTDILEGEVADRHRDPVWLAFNSVCGFPLAGLLGLGGLAGRAQWAWVAGMVLCLVVGMIVQLARGLAAKRRLPVAERLGIIAAFLERGLVSAEE